MRIRKPPEYLTQTDERILEFLRAEVKGTPKEIVDSGYASGDNKYISQRLKVLNDGGFVNRVAQGQYKISEKGQEYLEGEIDLRDEPEPN